MAAKNLIIAVLFLIAIPALAQEQPHFSKKRFIVQLSALAGSAIADGITTAHVQDRGGFEVNPIYGRHPSSGRLAAIQLGFFTSSGSLLWFGEHSHFRWMRWGSRSYVAGETAFHSFAAVHNTGVCPNGCPH